MTSPLDEQYQKIQGLPLESDPMSLAAQVVRSDVEHEVEKANRAISMDRHLMVALRCHNSSECRHLGGQIIDRRSPALLHGQVRRDRARLRRLQRNPRRNS